MSFTQIIDEEYNKLTSKNIKSTKVTYDKYINRKGLIDDQLNQNLNIIFGIEDKPSTSRNSYSNLKISRIVKSNWKNSICDLKTFHNNNFSFEMIY